MVLETVKVARTRQISSSVRRKRDIEIRERGYGRGYGRGQREI